MSSNNNNNNERFDNQSRKPSLAERFGDYSVATTSPSLLFSFLKRRLGFLSSREEEFYSEISEWAAKVFENVDYSKQCLMKMVEESKTHHMAAANTALFEHNCALKNGKVVYKRDWFNGTCFASQEYKNNHTFSLKMATSDCLIHEIIRRLKNLRMEMKIHGSHRICEFDTDVMNEIKYHIDIFAGLLEEAERLESQLSQFLKTHREETRRPRINRQNKPHVAPKGSWRAQKPTEPVQNNTNEEEVVVDGEIADLDEDQQ